jgi:hypothetical protein
VIRNGEGGMSPVDGRSWPSALDRTRTCDPGIRNPLLYPAELRALFPGG